MKITEKDIAEDWEITINIFSLQRKMKQNRCFLEARYIFVANLHNVECK